MKMNFGKKIRKLVKKEMKQSRAKLLSLIACIVMLCTLLAGCNTPLDKEGDSVLGTSAPVNSDKTEQTTDTETEDKTEPTEDHDLIIFSVDITRDGIKDTVIVDPIAAADETEVRKTVWVIDGITDEEIWSTSLGKANTKKGGVYLYKHGQAETYNLYFWQTYMLNENKLYVEGYYVFSRNDEYKIEAIPMERKNAQLDVSNYRTIAAGEIKFLAKLTEIASPMTAGAVPMYGDYVFTLLDTSSEELIYSTQEETVFFDELYFDSDKCIVYARFE